MGRIPGAAREDSSIRRDADEATRHGAVVAGAGATRSEATGVTSAPVVNESSYRAELDALPTKEVYLRARRRALRRLDVRFFWNLLRTIPAAEAAAGDVEEAQADVRSGIARLNDLRDAGEGKLGEALRPLYIDYLVKHAPRATRSDAPGG
jgi:hypothetical protein